MSWFRNKHHTRDPLWHAELIIVIAIALQITLPEHFTFGVHWLLPIFGVVLALLLAATTPRQKVFRSLRRRINVVLLIGVICIGNVYALVQVATQLLQEGRVH